MAEATIMLMLVSLYDLKSAENQLREMRPRPRGPMSARMVKGKTIGIIGYGNISRAIIRRLTGWDARIVVSTRAPDESSQGVAFVGQIGREHVWTPVPNAPHVCTLLLTNKKI